MQTYLWERISETPLLEVNGGRDDCEQLDQRMLFWGWSTVYDVGPTLG